MAKCKNCEELVHDGWDCWCMKKTEEAFLAKPAGDTSDVIENIEKEHECKWFKPTVPMTPQETDELEKYIEEESVADQMVEQAVEQEVLDTLMRVKAYKIQESRTKR
jgi:hypothetical protein